MGYEVRIRAGAAVGVERWDRALGALGFTRAATAASWELRVDGNLGPMPNVAVALEADGSLYVCDYGVGVGR